ncbi:TetR/AcrR family transcriptional regulator [Zavarzinia aquatilis]|uniref:TetR/AcrR family transcriptional regulator n=1 Tax=Zavarzinia aquatilis TaxID=2211142 RepID=UPI00140326A5|nr:TetR/AcrR family transcriptional regulator [Zavarzinia aquatilis]
MNTPLGAPRPGATRRKPAERAVARTIESDDADSLRAGRRRLGVVLKPAAQARSRNKLERLLEVGLEMMNEIGFDRMRVVDIAERAGCSTGAFYQRFADKEALLEALAQRFAEKAWTLLDTMLIPERFEGQPFAVVVRRMVVVMVRLASAHAVLLREVVRASLRDMRTWTYFSAMRDHMMARLFEVAGHYPEVTDKAAPGGPIELAVQIILSSLISRSLADQRIIAISDDDYAAELATLMIRYLVIDDAPWDAALSPTVD